MQGKQRTFRMLNAGQRVVAVMALLCGVSGVWMLSGCGGEGASAPPSVGASLRWLGTLPGGSESRAYGVSTDGRVVVGVSSGRAFRWTASGGMQDLGTLGGNRSEAYGVSADGAVVVGWAHNAAGQKRAFRWTASGGMQDLGTLGGIWSEARGVSADGAVVVGGASNAAGDRRAFRWTASGGMQDLGTVGGTWSEAWSVSADGAVVVGRLYYVEGQYYPFRWTASGGMQNLGTVGGIWGEARGVSADGAMVVGWSFSDGALPLALRWQNDVAHGLGMLPDPYNRSWAYGVSADGAVVVGYAANAAGDRRAFRWTPSRGMEDLNTTYASLLTNGSVLIEALAISPDGRYIVGVGRNAATGRNEAFLLDTGRGP